MNNQDHDRKPVDDPVEPDEALVARALRGAGPRPDLPPDLAARWQQHFNRELADSRAQRQGRRRWMAMGGAAVAALLVAVLVATGPQTTPSLGTPVDASALVAAVRGAVTLDHGRGEELALQDAGGALRLGDTLITGTDGGARLRYRQADVRVAANSRLHLRPGSLELATGQLYVDSGQDRAAGPPVVVTTAQGTLTHLGTQFLVHASRDATSVVVREGKVLLRARDDSRRALTVSAPPEGASMLRLDDRGQVERSRVASHAGTWSWVGGLAPGFSGQDTTAHGLLAWAAREQGLALRYMDVDARLHARDTQLRGQVEGLGAETAVHTVDTLTRLAVAHRDGVLVVRLRTPG